jgi:hypothetical protein
LAAAASLQYREESHHRHFGWQEGRSVLIESSTNLTTWTPLSTNVAAGTALRFADAESKTLPHRFYRARLLP